MPSPPIMDEKSIEKAKKTCVCGHSLRIHRYYPRSHRFGYCLNPRCNCLKGNERKEI